MTALSEKELIRYYNSLSEDQKKALSDQLKSGTVWVDHPIAEGKNLTHRAIGQLLFEFNSSDGSPKPMHNMDVELWDRDITSPDDFLGSSITLRDGSFVIWYDPEDAGKGDVPDLELRVFERQHEYDKDGNVQDIRKLIYRIEGEDNVTRLIYDFGVCKIPYWEYDPETSTPRVLITEEGEAPQAYAAGRALVMVKVLAAIELKKRMHIAMADRLTVREVQEDYPANLTREMEKNLPGSTRSDEFFGDRILNGMSANIIDRDPSNPDKYWLHYHFNSYEQDGIYAMPNIDVRLEIIDQKLIPYEITISLRQAGEKQANAPVKKITINKNEGIKWQQAKRIARVSSALIAELDLHLCTTHLNVEQYALAAYRNIRQNPIRYLLFPHIKEVSLINKSANELLLGETGYVTRATGFTEGSLNRRIREVVGTLDWKNWQPRKQIHETHDYAIAAQLYWKVLHEYVDAFFDLHLDGIQSHWDEIHLFSDELVENSVSVFMCNYLHTNLPETGALKSNGHHHTNPDGWYDWNERMDMSAPRPVVNGDHKAVSHVTQSDKMSDEGIANLKQVCAYVIHHATFVHWWSNSKQFAEGGELCYSSLGLRYGKNGLFTTEDDESVLPPVQDATMQLWISYMLSNSGFGFILKNEEKDIHPMFLDLLKKYSDEFAALGVNVDELPSRINI